MNCVFLSGFSLVWLVALVITIGFVFRWVMAMYESDDRKRERWENREDAISNTSLQRSKLENVDLALHIASKYNVKPDLVIECLMQGQQYRVPNEIPATRELVRR